MTSDPPELQSASALARGYRAVVLDLVRERDALDAAVAAAITICERTHHRPYTALSEKHTALLAARRGGR